MGENCKGFIILPMQVNWALIWNDCHTFSIT